MIHICAILLIICICEGIAISYFLKSKKKILILKKKLAFFGIFGVSLFFM